MLSYEFIDLVRYLQVTETLRVKSTEGFRSNAISHNWFKGILYDEKSKVLNGCVKRYKIVTEDGRDLSSQLPVGFEVFACYDMEDDIWWVQICRECDEDFRELAKIINGTWNYVDVLGGKQ